MNNPLRKHIVTEYEDGLSKQTVSTLVDREYVTTEKSGY